MHPFPDGRRGRRRRSLAAPAAALALAVAGCGNTDDGPQSTGNGADRAFAQEMVPHHESAVAMAQLGLQRGRSGYVRALSRDIVASQRTEIAQLQAAGERLADAGVEPGALGVGHAMMGMDMDTASLETAEPFDAAFVRMMAPHHEGAVTMARAELARGRDPELQQLARTIIVAQQREIAGMGAFLRRTG